MRRNALSIMTALVGPLISGPPRRVPGPLNTREGRPGGRGWLEQSGMRRRREIVNGARYDGVEVCLDGKLVLHRSGKKGIWKERGRWGRRQGEGQRGAGRGEGEREGERGRDMDRQRGRGGPQWRWRAESLRLPKSLCLDISKARSFLSTISIAGCV